MSYPHPHGHGSRKPVAPEGDLEDPPLHVLRTSRIRFVRHVDSAGHADRAADAAGTDVGERRGGGSDLEIPFGWIEGVVEGKDPEGRGARSHRQIGRAKDEAGHLGAAEGEEKRGCSQGEDGGAAFHNSVPR